MLHRPHRAGGAARTRRPPGAGRGARGERLAAQRGGAPAAAALISGGKLPLTVGRTRLLGGS